MGQVKQIDYETNEREYEGDALTHDSTTTFDAKLSVLAEDDTSYTVEMLYTDIAMKAVLAMATELEKDLTGYERLKIVYSVNKKSGESHLKNWEEARDFMLGSFRSLTELMGGVDPELGSLGSIILAPLMQAFDSKSSTEEYMANHIGFFLIPFEHTTSLNDTISTTEYKENPFNPAQEIASTTNLILTKVDAQKGVYTFREETVLDLSSFIEMLKSMMDKMAGAFGASDSAMTKAKDEMNSFEMDMTAYQEVEFDAASTWITSVTQVAKVVTTDPRTGLKSVKESITRVKIH